MRFQHMKSQAAKYTFKDKKVRLWVERHVEGRVLNLFAGKTLLNCNEYRNDIREEMPADCHKDALEFVKTWTGDKFNTIILDPPFSARKSREKYRGAMASPLRILKDSLINILALRGIVITFGYHSISMGKYRGFQVERILIISHGGSQHDTIATIERRIPSLI